MRPRYHDDLFQLVRTLLAPPLPGRPRTLNDLMPFIGFRFYTELESGARYAAELEGDLGRELQNGRLLRIMVCVCVFGVVCVAAC